MTAESSTRSASASAATPPKRRVRTWLWGPAFVAAIAYVDPGNVAANLTAGARFGYLLVWVLVGANVMALLVQYLSAKTGLVTGQSLPELLGGRLRRGPRIAFWLQAELVAAATDLAEVIGGAIALHILFGIPLLWGGVIVGVVSMLLLSVQSRHGQRPFEFVVMGLLLIITIGFMAGLFVSGAGGTLDVSAGKDLNLTGAQVVNAGTGGSTSLKASNTINLATVGEAHQQSVSWNSSAAR